MEYMFHIWTPYCKVVHYDVVIILTILSSLLSLRLYYYLHSDSTQYQIVRSFRSLDHLPSRCQINSLIGSDQAVEFSGILTGQGRVLITIFHRLSRYPRNFGTQYSLDFKVLLSTSWSSRQASFTG
jgi:hypothetical protein